MWFITRFITTSLARGFLHSHTHAGNALACRAALATLDIFEQDKVIQANRIKASYLNQAAPPDRIPSQGEKLS